MIQIFAEAEEKLAATLPGYESRVPQQKLAQAVTGAIETRRHLLGQAGTGTGKSLAYLISGIISGKRVVIATATKVLQDQIAQKDLPFLEAHLGVPFTFAVLKGRKNYLCLNGALNAAPADVPNLALIIEASKAEGFTGERESLPFEITGPEWNHVCADSDECSANKCKKHPEACWAEQARARAREAQVVVVNHALLLTDLKIMELTGGAANMLEAYQVLVVDEAHEMESYATSALGTTFREAGIRGLCVEVTNFAHRDVPTRQEELQAATGAIMVALQNLWDILEPGRIRAKELVEDHPDEFVALANALTDLDDLLTDLTLTDDVAYADLDGAKKRQARLSRRAHNAAARFVEVVTASFDDLVRFVETEKTPGGREQKILRTAPINVAPYLRENLFSDPEITAVLVSATLAVDGDFSYVATRLGVDDYDGLDVGSPFDFAKQGKLYIPRDIPEPTPATRAAWSSLMTQRIYELIRISEGRALVLFTSHKEMIAAYNSIAPRVPYLCLKQGDDSNKVLGARFIADTHSVLFATRSFMTGFDVQGESLSLLVADKVPFAVPTEPITEARCEAIKRAGGNDFSDFVIPSASLILQQAVGRLIRHRNDRGVVAILDPRLLSKGWGKKIRRALPPFGTAESLTEVEEFFAREAVA